MTLLTYARGTDDVPFLAVVADNSEAHYVFPSRTKPWLNDDRVSNLASLLSEPPADEKAWLDLACSRLGVATTFDVPFDDFDTNSSADAAARSYLDEENKDVVPDRTAVSMAADDAYAQVAQDYPDFGEDPNSLDPEAMLNFVTMTLGPIDPEGPNGWVLRAANGEPRPGDENEYLHLGVESPDGVRATSDDDPGDDGE